MTDRITTMDLCEATGVRRSNLNRIVASLGIRPVGTTLGVKRNTILLWDRAALRKVSEYMTARAGIRAMRRGGKATKGR